MKHLILASLTALALAAGISSPALAQSADETRAAQAGSPRGVGTRKHRTSPSAQPPPPSIASSLGPLGDLWGARTSLEKAGITFSLTYIGEVLGNTSDGLRRGSIYEGRLDTQIDADLEKLLGWSGAASTPTSTRSTAMVCRATIWETS